MKPALIAAALFLAACQMPADPPVTEDACGAEALQHLVGGPVAAAQEATAPGSVRVIGPGQAVTMDYRADRLNVEHDEGAIIRRVYCG